MLGQGPLLAWCTLAQDPQDQRQAKQDPPQRSRPSTLFGCTAKRLAKQGVAA